MIDGLVCTACCLVSVQRYRCLDGLMAMSFSCLWKILSCTKDSCSSWQQSIINSALSRCRLEVSFFQLQNIQNMVLQISIIICQSATLILYREFNPSIFQSFHIELHKQYSLSNYLSHHNSIMARKRKSIRTCS